MCQTPAQLDLYLTSYHEGGHAVVACSLGVPVRGASLLPDGAGACEMFLHPQPTPEDVTALVAGGVAEMVAAHKLGRADAMPMAGMTRDAELIGTLLQRAGYTAAGIQDAIAAAAERAQRIIGERWFTVSIVALHLLLHRSMSGAELAETVGKLKGW